MLNKITFLSSLIFSLAGASSVAEASNVLVFDRSRSGEFQLLVPGGSQAQQVQSDPELQQDFEALAAPTDAAYHTIEVPVWLKSRSSPFTRYAIGNGAGCDRPRYYLPHPSLSSDVEKRRQSLYWSMVDAACEAGVPVELFDALVAAESEYNVSAKSSAGAIGLTQLMPGTARELGVVDPYDAEQNLRGGAEYLAEQLESFGEWDLALGAYNAGPGRIREYGKVPPFAETQKYVNSILKRIVAARKASFSARRITIASSGAELRRP
ncbi:lytic transglycosylase domain-containing protein [Altericroceibacterium spongiae]|uniref:Lytic transglycosylase domain-containing protein n=1 Tax=Altericroceibacterium spongiae TaxID=2320269 RepID=A0A420EAM2_9SPHN|nr:lytic transglycosylase domain-containing protein [Altericroceibacterium spongiae]RKF17692.1 lytic transglycosylase domain-containing protein [Altericroceibacterium spongiae]